MPHTIGAAMLAVTGVANRIMASAAASAPSTAANPARSRLRDASSLVAGQNTPASASSEPTHKSAPHAADHGAPIADCTTLGCPAAAMRRAPHAAQEASRPTSSG